MATDAPTSTPAELPDVGDEDLAQLLSDVRRIADGVGSILELGVKVLDPPTKQPPLLSSEYRRAVVRELRVAVHLARVEKDGHARLPLTIMLGALLAMGEGKDLL